MTDKLQQLGKDFGLDEISEAGHWAMISSPDWIAGDLVDEANAGNDDARRWLARLVAPRELRNQKKRQQEVLKLYDDIAQMVKSIRTEAHFSFDKDSGQCEWAYMSPTDGSFSDMEAVYAARLARVIGADLDKKIKRCALTYEKTGRRCPNFVFTMSKREHCFSKACDRERGRQRMAKSRRG